MGKISSFPIPCIPKESLDEEIQCVAHGQDLAYVQGETDLFDKSDPEVSNDEFLEGIFGNVDGNQRPLVCGFKGHPGEVSSGKWGARPWQPGETQFDDQANNYFTPARFTPDTEGTYRRKKYNFVALHALVLDDIGTKVEMVRMTLSPSWKLETSHNNYQFGYILSEPHVDGPSAERVMKMIISACLCDPGADGPLARYARLPVGNNGKSVPPFKCRLREWHPERRYTLQEIEEGFGLDLSPTLTPEQRQGIGSWISPAATGVDDRIYIPRSPENPVITGLKEKGLYIRPVGNGKHEIKCPFQHEHTNAEGGGSAYWEPDESSPTGGFKCFHGHCSKRHMRDLRDYLGVTKNVAANRPTIRLRQGCLGEIIDHFEQELARIGFFYQRAGIVVHIGTDPGTKETTIRPLSVYLMIRILSKYVCFEKFDRRRNEWVAYDPPYSHCRNLYESGKYPHLPILLGLTSQPYLRPDRSLMVEPGYDQGTGLFGIFDQTKFALSDAPSRQEAEDALAIILNLLNEFSFKTKHDEAAAVSAILTATIRPSLSLAPMYHCRAPQISSGKSYLTSIFSCFATASSASGTTFPSNDEECQKLLLASFMKAPAVLCFDNMTSDLLPHKSLCCALTEEFITGRILGFSKTTTVGTRILLLSSGNNVGPTQDMCRRTVIINLDPACEIPAARTFKNQPLSVVRSHREFYVSLALTVIRAWIVAGSPITKVPPVATYNEWSDLCRQPLLWLGYPDPAESIFSSMNQDPDRETLGRLLHAWDDCFRTKPKMIREAISMANQELLYVFMDIAGERDKLNNRRLGRWISRKAGRIVDGLKFERDSSTRSAEAWKVIHV